MRILSSIFFLLTFVLATAESSKSSLRRLDNMSDKNASSSDCSSTSTEDLDTGSDCSSKEDAGQNSPKSAFKTEQDKKTEANTVHLASTNDNKGASKSAGMGLVILIGAIVSVAAVGVLKIQASRKSSSPEKPKLRKIDQTLANSPTVRGNASFNAFAPLK